MVCHNSSFPSLPIIFWQSSWALLETGAFTFRGHRLTWIRACLFLALLIHWFATFAEFALLLLSSTLYSASGGCAMDIPREDVIGGMDFGSSGICILREFMKAG